MKKASFLLLLMFAVAMSAGALDTSDPTDGVYRQLDLWAGKGYVTRLPLLRPYPAQLVAALLRDVIDGGDPESVRRAEAMLAEVTRKIAIRPEAYHATRATQDDVYSVTGGYAAARGSLTDLITLSTQLGALAVVEPGAEAAFIPGERFPVDYYVDWSALSPAGITVLPTLSAGGTAAIGTDSFWFQIGLARHSFGPFDEGPVLSPQAAQAGHLSFSWRGPRLSYTEFLLTLTATSDRGDAFGDDGDVSVYPNKYLTGHSFQFSPLSWLDIGLFETVVFGERIEPVYLVPVVSRTYTSIYAGSIDNLMLGFSASARLPADVGLDLVFYADDMHFLDMLSLDFDTKYKVAAQAGVSWTPLRRLLKRVSLDYALVTPYTYTHTRESIQGVEEQNFANGMYLNYYNYSHYGRSLVALDPNSDRLRLRALLTPRDRLAVTLSATYQRHANATESEYIDGSAVGTSDGGINDNGYVDDGDHLFDTVNFLSQDVIEQILLLGAEASWQMPLGRGVLFVEVGYTLEVAQDKRSDGPAPTLGTWTNGPVPIEGNDLVLHHVSLGLRYAY